MHFNNLEVTNGFDADFNIEISASSRISGVFIEDGNLNIKYLDSGFNDELDVYNFKVFVIGERSNYGNLGSNDSEVEGYIYYGKKFYSDCYLYYFGKQTDRIKTK